MRKWIGILAGAIVAVLLILTISCKLAVTPAVNKVSSYAEDRAQIEDLQARYLFALDFFDMDTYVSNFTEDGILDIVAYQAKGRAEIRKKLEEARPVFNPASEKKPGLYPPTGRHNITNIVLKIDGNKVVGRSYWSHYGNNNPQRAATLDGYGHYEDEMVKVNGKWLFAKRKIYNEGVEK